MSLNNEIKRYREGMFDNLVNFSQDCIDKYDRLTIYIGAGAIALAISFRQAIPSPLVCIWCYKIGLCTILMCLLFNLLAYAILRCNSQHAINQYQNKRDDDIFERTQRIQCCISAIVMWCSFVLLGGGVALLMYFLCINFKKNV